MEITLDTHSLIWYLDKSLNKKLSTKALSIIKKAEKNGIIYISIIVLMEILYLIEKNRINYDFNDLLILLEKNIAYKIIPLDTLILEEIKLLKRLEIHDRIILATAKITNTSLISKDKVIRNNYKNIIWD